jgi:hypothetical protein
MLPGFINLEYRLVTGISKIKGDIKKIIMRLLKESCISPPPPQKKKNQQK